MNGDFWFILLVAGGVALLLFPLLKIIFMPLKVVFKIIINSAIGFILLWLINTFGGLIGFFLPINIVTILITGFLGIPGIILLGVVKYLIPF
ncbi:MAG: pro-sigmaK processing inhibitor BofA family protein [Desulfitobacteriaceae bacterium]|nr:pro-sigmaK processing inhibitor BofA family protein [Desulfitobacteriaceae bacterium]MDD4753669.1 pro-sigmaK processing inhibitor BofA family protein [Desulfitobacteriaceae bacterium]